METTAIIIALVVTTLAGLATGIGSAMTLFSKRTDKKTLSLVLGFSAGVMIYISFMVLLPQSQESLLLHLGQKTGPLMAIITFFGGIFLMALIDRVVPLFHNPHEVRLVEEMDDRSRVIKEKKLLRMGLLSAFAISIHNFPEGIATFVTMLKTPPAIGYSNALAIALHNIPEGIVIAIPIFYATGSRKKAFKYSFLSGFAEPIGALIGLGLIYFILPSTIDIITAFSMASVAGVMVFISIDELLPTARKYGEHHLAIYGLILGMLVIGAGLILFS